MAKGRYRDGTRSSIGQEHLRAALQRVENYMLRDIASCTEPLTMDECVRMFFRDEDIAKLKELSELAYSCSTYCQYPLDISQATEISLHFEHAAPARELLHFQPERGEAFTNLMTAIRAKREQYGLVKFVLRWLDANATPGAIRALWPSILQVCPNAPAFKDLQQAPVRYITPKNAGPMLQMFRDTATTVALMGMMPDSLLARNPHGAAYLMLSGQHYDYTGIKVYLDSIRIGLLAAS